jgi:HK97 family phage portal protein
VSLYSRIETRIASLVSPAETWARDVFPTTTATNSGVDVGADRARQLTSVWACQSLIADGLASLPVDIVKVDKKGRRKPVDRPKWLDTPNPFETWFTFVHKLVISLIGASGNGFVLTPRNSDGVVESVWVLDPQFCDVDEYSTTPVVTVDGVPKTPQEVVHIPGFVVPGRRAGISMISAAREAIGLGLAAEEFGARFFSQGASMTGVIEHPGKASPGEAAVIGRMMKKSHSGMKNSHAIGVLTGGATFKPISITPNEAQFLETRKFQAVQIAALYRVPPHMIDPSVQSSWGSGIEEQNAFFAEYTLVPWIARLEQAFSRLLPVGQVIKWNLDAKLRAKLSERYAAYAVGLSNGFLNGDDVREKEDLDPIPDGLGQKFYRPANLIELGKEPPDEGASNSDSSPPAGDKPKRKDGAGSDADPKGGTRHLPGRHNQKDHGHRGPREWSLGNLGEYRSKTRERFKSVKDPEALEGILDQLASPDHVVHVSGDVTVSWHSDVSMTDKQKEDLLRHVDNLQSKVGHGLSDLLVTVIPHADMPIRNAVGSTSRKNRTILLSEGIFNGDAPERPDRLMSSRRTFRRDQYTLAHEWGHVLDDLTDGDLKAVAAAAGDLGMSEYGKEHPRERLAEAFAEWFLTGGTSNNQAVRRFAEALGWTL